MTKETLYIKLRDAINGGYLENIYFDDTMSIFRFLKTVWVGFLHEDTRERSSDQSDPQGVLLTETEANVVIRSTSCRALRFLGAQETSCMIFSEKLIAMCHSTLGRWRLKRQIKKRHYHHAKAQNAGYEPLDEMDEDIGFEIIYGLNKRREECVSKRKSHTRIVKILGAVAAFGCLIWILYLFTADLREQWNPEKLAEVFDKNGERYVYSYIEADLLSPLALVHQNDNYDWYYLYGNLEKGTYGVIRFDSLHEELTLMPTEEKSVVFAEPVRLYGMTRDIPLCVSLLPLEPLAEWEGITLPGDTTTLPDGTELVIPERDVSLPGISEDILHEIDVDCSKEAMAFFAEHGISIDDSWDLGEAYLSSSMKPEKDTAAINQFLDGLWTVMMCVSLILLIPLFRYGGKADYETVKIQRINRGMELAVVMIDVLARHREEETKAIE